MCATSTSTSDGVVDLDALHAMVNEHTALVSVMAVNNETGVRQPLDGVNSIAKTFVPGGVPRTPTPWPPRRGSACPS